MDWDATTGLPKCAGCARVLTGNIGVSVCSCIHCYCRICLVDYENKYCEQCKEDKPPAENQQAQEILKSLYAQVGTCVVTQGLTEDIMKRLKEVQETLYLDLQKTVACRRTEDPLPANPRNGVSLPPGFIPSASFLRFPAISPAPRLAECFYCKQRLSSAPSGRCPHCHKVNFPAVQFHLSQFLSTKWECRQCHLRNVHSNDKCIECGSWKDRRSRV